MTKLKTSTAITVAILPMIWSAPIAMAQSMPRYDVEGHCSEVANTIGGSSVIYNSCVEMEQEAYNKQKSSWLEIPLKIRNHCDEVSRAIGGSYSILDSCIEMEIDAARSTPSFKY